MGSEAKDWSVLSGSLRAEERSGVTTTDLDAAQREVVAGMRGLLDRATEVLAVEAQQWADVYWGAHRSACEDKEQGRVGTRVRLVGPTLVAEWYRNRFVDQGPGQKKRVLSTYIKKGRSEGYSMAQFKREPGWARGLIRDIESRYVVLRRRNAALGKVRRALAEYERLLASDGGLDQGGDES